MLLHLRLLASTVTSLGQRRCHNCFHHSLNIIPKSVMQRESEDNGDLQNLDIELRQKEEPGKRTGKEEMEEGGDLLNMVLKWKQKQVLEAKPAGAASRMQVSFIQLRPHNGFCRIKIL